MRFRVPQALPWDVNVIRVNYRCLEAPRVYRDLDGYFSEPPVIRRVVGGLVSAPKGFEAVVQPRVAHIAMLPIFKAVPFDLESYKAPQHIFQFGVDIPYPRKFGVSHVQNAR